MFMFIKKFKRVCLMALLLLMAVSVWGCSMVTDGRPATNQNSSNGELLEVYFIDVGQADSILVKTHDGKVMLIDAGNNADSSFITGYLKQQKISRIDILVGTHPHEDHIGGLDAVIQNFDIGEFYMPRKLKTSQTFEDVINAAVSKGLKITEAKAGIENTLGENVRVNFLYPQVGGYDGNDENEYSAVIKLTYGKISFLFMGDAGKIAENIILDSKVDISANVLKVGHHGSSTSTSNDFLSEVNPDYAVISVGEGNDYNHPASSTLEKLKSKDIKIYRTDKLGTIIASTDGSSLQFSTDK